jgi:hypothetical protein
MKARLLAPAATESTSSTWRTRQVGQAFGCRAFNSGFFHSPLAINRCQGVFQAANSRRPMTVRTGSLGYQKVLNSLD